MNEMPLRSLPDDLRTKAGELSSFSGSVPRLLTDLERGWARLGRGWDWEAEAGVTVDYHRALAEVSRMEAMLIQIGEALARTAEIFEAADRAAATLFTIDGMGGEAGSLPVFQSDVLAGLSRQGGDPPLPPPPIPLIGMMALILAGTNLREDPTTEGDATPLTGDAIVTIVDGPVIGGEYTYEGNTYNTWYEVQLISSGETYFVASMFVDTLALHNQNHSYYFSDLAFMGCGILGVTFALFGASQGQLSFNEIYQQVLATAMAMDTDEQDDLQPAFTSESGIQPHDLAAVTQLVIASLGLSVSVFEENGFTERDEDEAAWTELEDRLEAGDRVVVDFVAHHGDGGTAVSGCGGDAPGSCEDQFAHFTEVVDVITITEEDIVIVDGEELPPGEYIVLDETLGSGLPYEGVDYGGYPVVFVPKDEFLNAWFNPEERAADVDEPQEVGYWMLVISPVPDAAEED
jgi:uncharacterized protein YukE